MKLTIETKNNIFEADGAAAWFVLINIFMFGFWACYGAWILTITGN